MKYILYNIIWHVYLIYMIFKNKILFHFYAIKQTEKKYLRKNHENRAMWNADTITFVVKYERKLI